MLKIFGLLTTVKKLTPSSFGSKDSHYAPGKINFNYWTTGNHRKTEYFWHRTSYHRSTKNCFQIIEVHKKPNTITEQPKTKFYTGSNATDRTLQLNIIKTHALPGKWSQRCEIKKLNSKRYNVQVNFTRYSIKNKLFEINKE